MKKAVLRIRIRIRICQIRMILGLLDPDPDPLVRGMDPDPSIIKNLDSYCFLTSKISKQKNYPQHWKRGN
jgi:hypothetical protein